MPETAIDLIKDLTERLGAMASEFGNRAATVASRHVEQVTGDGSDAPLVMRARQVLAERKARRRYFPCELFHEPAWDMLIGLFIARAEGQTITVKVLATFADAPITTSQRWIDHLFRVGLITRHTDPADRRRIEVALSESGVVAMTDYLTGLLPTNGQVRSAA